MPSDLPPVAPGRLPLLGHLPALLRRPLPFVQSLPEYGEVVVIHLARTPAYLVTELELVRQVLVKDAGSFDKGVQYEKLGSLLGQSVSTMSGQEHRERRRQLQPAFHRQLIAGHAQLIEERVERLISSWQPGEVLQVDEAMRTLVLDVLTHTLCSSDPGPELATTVQRDLPLVLRGVAWRVLLSNKTIESLPLPTNRRFAAAVGRIREAASTVQLDYHAPGQLTDDVINLLAAGSETTGSSLAWMWHAIGSHPEVEERIHKEAVGGGTEYAARVARETLRLYPPGWIVSRRTRCAVRLGPYEVPPGAQVLFSPYALQRDPAHYTDPLRFDPDRWLPERRTAVGRQAFLAFGTGPQNCIGEGLALLTMTSAATAISRRFRLVPTGTVRLRAAATLTPGRLSMRLQPR